jgi:DhnA family fructose-bisphosphate aldolase class Ia
MLPVDDSLISGPSGGLTRLGEFFSKEVVAELDSVMAFRGSVEACAAQLAHLPVVVNVSASTVRSNHTDKVIVTSVESAVRMGAHGVAFHLNHTAATEGAMLGRLGAVVDAADRLGIPVLVVAYPRKAGGTSDADNNYLDEKENDRGAYASLLRHAVRVAVELGASMVKTYYSGDVDSFRTVIDAALGVPVVIAGGPPVEDAVAIDRATQAVEAGARGVSFGRQVFLHHDPAAFLARLRTALSEQGPLPKS